MHAYAYAYAYAMQVYGWYQTDHWPSGEIQLPVIVRAALGRNSTNTRGSVAVEIELPSISSAMARDSETPQRRPR
jgi:hypothetical protein